MTKSVISFIVLCVAMCLGQAREQPSTKSKGEITMTGCVSRLNSNFILMQSDQSSSYQLEESNGVKLAPYLGKEVEVTGVESMAMSTSSPRATTANPLQITVHSIKTIHKRCSSK